MAPVTTQLYQSYPVILQMLHDRGYDTSAYPPLTLEYIERQQQHTPVSSPLLAPVAPVIVHAKDDHTHTAFRKTSREHTDIANKLHDGELSAGFRTRYPVLANVLDNVQDAALMIADESDPRAAAIHELSAADRLALVHELTTLYADAARPRAEVNFHQCFNPENLWGANSRDKKFMAEMDAAMESLEATARELHSTHTLPTTSKLPEEVRTALLTDVANEIVDVYKRSYTIICTFRTRSKASETLDKKYDVHVMDIMANHGVFVQLFNLRSLMFNVTAHEIVPAHEQVDVWRNSDEVDRIKRVYNVRNVSRAFPVIPVNDPVAKFIGLRRGQLCKITRVNQTSGTFVTYRWCK